MLAQQQQWPVSVLGEVLEVSRSGFYPYVHWYATPGRKAAEAALVARVKAMAAQTRYS